MRKVYLILFFVISQFLCCKDNSPIESESKSSYVRLVNFNYNSLSLDLFVDDVKIIESVFPNNSSGYLKAPIGNNSVNLSYSDSLNSLYTKTVDFKQDEYYSLFTAFRNDSMRIFWFEENLNINEDSVGIRLFHYSKVGDTLDFKIANSTDSLIFESINYGVFTNTFNMKAGLCYQYIRPFEYSFFAKYDTLLNLGAGNSYTYIVRDTYYISPWYPYVLFRLQDNSEGTNIISVN